MEQKPRIASRNLQKIVLKDGSWVTVKGSMNYETFKMFFGNAQNIEDDIDANKLEGDERLEKMSQQMEFMIGLLKEVIVDWNFIDEKGDSIEFDPELIEDFDLYSLQEIFTPVAKIYSAQKKSSQSSMPTSDTTNTEEERPSSS